jgi:hypothetical protein
MHALFIPAYIFKEKRFKKFIMKTFSMSVIWKKNSNTTT